MPTTNKIFCPDCQKEIPLVLEGERYVGYCDHFPRNERRAVIVLSKDAVEQLKKKIKESEK